MLLCVNRVVDVCCLTLFDIRCWKFVVCYLVLLDVSCLLFGACCLMMSVLLFVWSCCLGVYGLLVGVVRSFYVLLGCCVLLFVICFCVVCY